MTTIILCTDGSDLALQALQSGLSLLRPIDTAIIATVGDELDDSLVTGASGFAGGAMSPDELDAARARVQAEAAQVLADTLAELGLDHAETVVLEGHPGQSLCRLAADRHADALVMGSRGRGGLKRALLGSVSDYVVRNAPCTVMITRDDA